VNTDHPRLYREKLLLAAEPAAVRQPVTGAAVRYVDWLFRAFWAEHDVQLPVRRRLRVLR